MAVFNDQNQLIIQHEDNYYNRVIKDGTGLGDRELEPGNYQFVTLETIINQFLISYVGRDKIIPRVNRLDVQYHAMRGLQEFSYDTLRSYRGFEFSLPNSLSMILPQDFVAYTQVSWSDSNGTKHPIHYTHDTSNPRNPYQHSDANARNQFSVHAKGTTTAGSNFVELDGLYPEIFGAHGSVGGVRVKFLNLGIFQNLTTPGMMWVYAAWHDKTTGKTTIELSESNANMPIYATIAATDINFEFRTTDVWSTSSTAAKTHNLIPSIPRPIMYNPTFDTTSNRITAESPGDVADIKIGMKVVASNNYFSKNNNLVIDVDYTNGYVYTYKSKVGANAAALPPGFYPINASTLAPPGGSFSAVPSLTFIDEDQLKKNENKQNAGPYMNENSDTLNNFSSISTGDSNTVDDEDFWRYLPGNRYGLDPQRAQGNGTFYIDEAKGTMRFSSDLVGKTIIIDYISDSLGQKREQIVHKFAEEAMYKWIAHAILATRQNTPEYLVARFKKERFAETRKAKLRLSNINFKEFTQILRGKSKQIKH